jgi:hypothetical protein
MARIAIRITAYSLCIALATIASAEQVVRGRVIFDANGNGQLDAGEKGLAGVAITDGINFVSTGDDGTFEIKTADDPVIPFKKAQVVSVSWPTGKWPTSLWYRRLADIRPGEALLFGLQDEEQKLPLTVAHGSDPHNNFSPGGISDAWRDEVKRLAGSARFAIVTGDLGYAGIKNAEQMFTSLQRYTQNFPIPMFHTPGNHDLVGIHTTEWKGQTELHGNGAYTKYLGPLRWSFDYAGVHFVGLDWAYEAEDGKLQTGMSKSAIDWMEKDFARLAAGTRIFAFTHSQYTVNPKYWQVLQKFKMELMLAGHSHQNLNVGGGGLKMLTTINLRGPNAPYRLLHIHAQGHDTVDRCAGGLSGRHTRHCSLSVPGPLANLRRAQAALENVTLKDGKRAVEKISGRWFELLTQFDPKSAKSCGVRILSTDPAQPPLELAFEGNTMRCGPLVNPMVRLDQNEPLQLQVHIVNGQAKVRAQGRLFFERPFRTEKPCRAELFAEGGEATFEKVDAWQLAHDDVKTLAGLVHHHGYQRQKRRAAAYQQLIDKLKEE